jgi:hypothetical protein
MSSGLPAGGAGLRRAAAFALLAGAACGAALAQDDPVDRLEEALVFGSADDTARVQLSGTLDLEGYYQSQAQTGLLFSESDASVNPRLSLFLDAQVGDWLYAFAQARADNGFDPGEGGAQVRLDEYLLRFTPGGDGRFSLQAGKFATVVGNWALRHGSWDNPFVTAPLPYENLTGIWDTTAARSASEILAWSGVLPRPSVGGAFLDVYRNVPVIWGPSYATGAAVLGSAGPMTYALEVKNASLSSNPESWNPSGDPWREPTVSGRLGLTPGEMWNFGISGSTGPYLEPGAADTLPPGRGLGQYREIVLGQDASFAWHHVQLWAECYEARFEVPGVGNADTLAYYVEGKLKLTPQFFAALRWNQQLFPSIGGGPPSGWSRGVERLDAGPCYRFTPHLQGKLQCSIERQDADLGRWSSLVAAQLTARF